MYVSHYFHHPLNLRIGSKSSFSLSLPSRFGLFLEVRSMDCPLLSFRKLSAAFLTTPRSRAHGWTFIEHMTAFLQLSFLIDKVIPLLPRSTGLVVYYVYSLADHDYNFYLIGISNNEYRSSASNEVLVRSRCSVNVC